MEKLKDLILFIHSGSDFFLYRYKILIRACYILAWSNRADRNNGIKHILAHWSMSMIYKYFTMRYYLQPNPISSSPEFINENRWTLWKKNVHCIRKSSLNLTQDCLLFSTFHYFSAYSARWYEQITAIY